jgi:hypothetical protein
MAIDMKELHGRGRAKTRGEIPGTPQAITGGIIETLAGMVTLEEVLGLLCLDDADFLPYLDQVLADATCLQKTARSRFSHEDLRAWVDVFQILLRWDEEAKAAKARLDNDAAA